jgi:precorrin-2/cobalt-factor-2 C20-methyltransferase
MSYKTARPGIFYAVGIGPGSPDLLTIRAANLIRTADIIVAPRSRISEESMALQAAAPYLREQGQEVVEHIYAMKRDAVETQASWNAIGMRIREWLEAGKSVVQITLGDPLIYSTSHYLLSALRTLGVEANNIVIVPGISAFQATAARVAQSLAIQRGRVTLMCADDAEQISEALRHCETLIVYKSGKHIDTLRANLQEAGVLDKSVLACYVEQENEFICQDLSNLKPETMPGYLSTLIVFQGERTWHAAD